MNALRHAACVALAAVALLAAPAHATSFTTDQSDLWWIPAESGWGIELVQRGSVIFATLFVYGASGQPTWFVSTMDYTSNLTWSGNLYATTGPYFATMPYNEADFGGTIVGTMTWAETDVDHGTLTYTVNGIPVVKNITRETLVLDYFGGFYMGGIHQSVTGCNNGSLNGVFDLPGSVTFVQSGTSVTIQTDQSGGGPTCSYSGTLSQSGQMGSIATTPFSCSDGSQGTLSVQELQVTPSGLSGTFSSVYTFPAGCQATGRLGGVRGIVS